MNTMNGAFVFMPINKNYFCSRVIPYNILFQCIFQLFDVNTYFMSLEFTWCILLLDSLHLNSRCLCINLLSMYILHCAHTYRFFPFLENLHIFQRHLCFLSLCRTHCTMHVFLRGSQSSYIPCALQRPHLCGFLN